MSIFKKLSQYFYIIIALFVVFAGLYDVAESNAPSVRTITEKDEAIKLPIVMYHSLLKDKKYQGRYVISPSLLESDLKYLKENGFNTVTTEDLINHFEKNVPLPENPIMLTFDDGYYNNFIYALPLLREYDMKAVFSIIGIQSERFSERNERNANYSHMTWQQLKIMQESGHAEIQNHSYNLHRIDGGRTGAKKKKGESAAEYEKILTEDILKLQNLLIANCGIKPTAFTYPYGAVSDNSVAIIKKLGFKASFTCLQKMNYIEKEEDLFLLNRFLRTEETSESFFERVGLRNED